MSKKGKTESVVHEWVSDLPFMQQALLMTAMRGPDGCRKYNAAKNIVKYMRGAVLKPAGEITGNEDSFMWINYALFEEYTTEFFFDNDAYPMHFLMHLFHSAQVVGYNHPDDAIRAAWFRFYVLACKSLHMGIENKKDMNKRMAF